MAERLRSVVLRMGMLATLRARSVLEIDSFGCAPLQPQPHRCLFFSCYVQFSGGQVVGAVITASHNAEVDNGIKLVDRDGGEIFVNAHYAHYSPPAACIHLCSCVV